MALRSVIIVNIWDRDPVQRGTPVWRAAGNPGGKVRSRRAGRGDRVAGVPVHHLAGARPVINVVLVLGVIYTPGVVDIILGLTGGGLRQREPDP